MVRGMRPIPKIIHETMFLSVAMDVLDQGRKIALGCDRQAAKMMLKQTTRAPVGFVDGFGVGIQPVVEGVAHAATIQLKTDSVSETESVWVGSAVCSDTY